MRYQDVILADRPYGLWMLDERIATGGDAKGLGPAGNANYNGGPTQDVPGPSGAIPRATRFDGTNDSVNLPITPMSWLTSTAPQSWEFWAYSTADFTSSAGARVLLGVVDASFQAFTLGSDATGRFTGEIATISNDRGGAGDGNGWFSVTIPAGWHYHCWTYNGTQGGWTYYLDGRPWLLNPTATASAVSGGSFGMISNTGTVEFVLAHGSGTFHQWQGIAAVAVYPYMLSTSQIMRHYVAGRAGGRDLVRRRVA